MTRTTPHDDWQWFLRRAAEVVEDPALEGLRAERHELAARLQGLLAAARNGDALGPALRWVVDIAGGLALESSVPGVARRVGIGR